MVQWQQFFLLSKSIAFLALHLSPSLPPSTCFIHKKRTLTLFLYSNFFFLLYSYSCYRHIIFSKSKFPTSLPLPCELPITARPCLWISKLEDSCTCTQRAATSFSASGSRCSSSACCQQRMERTPPEKNWAGPWQDWNLWNFTWLRFYNFNIQQKLPLVTASWSMIDGTMSVYSYTIRIRISTSFLKVAALFLYSFPHVAHLLIFLLYKF